MPNKSEYFKLLQEELSKKVSYKPIATTSEKLIVWDRHRYKKPIIGYTRAPSYLVRFKFLSNEIKLLKHNLQWKH